MLMQMRVSCFNVNIHQLHFYKQKGIEDEDEPTSFGNNSYLLQYIVYLCL